MILLSSNETTQLPTKISFGHTHTHLSPSARPFAQPATRPTHVQHGIWSSIVAAHRRCHREQPRNGWHARPTIAGQPCGRLLHAADHNAADGSAGCRRSRYVQQHNCIVNMETHTTWCVRSTLVINMVILWSLQATCLETGRRTAAPVEFGRPSVFEPAELPLSGTGRLTDCQKQCSSSDTTRPATCLKSGLPAPAFGSTLCSKCSRVQCHRV